MMRLPTLALPLLAPALLGLVAMIGTSTLTSPGISTPVTADPALAARSTPARIASAGVLRVGAKFDHPGLSMKNLQGTPEGFEVDMVEYLAARIGLQRNQIQWTEVTSANREQLLMQGKVDIVVATLTVTDKRRKLIGFAGPYLDIAQDLIVPKGNPQHITSPVSPPGLLVCSTLGGAVTQATRKAYPGVRLVEFDNSAKCIDAIKIGAVDAFATQGPIGAGYVSKDPQYLEMLGRPYGPEKWGIGLKKGDVSLCTFLDQQLAAFESDGSYQRAWSDSIGRYSKTPASLPDLEPCR